MNQGTKYLNLFESGGVHFESGGILIESGWVHFEFDVEANRTLFCSFLKHTGIHINIMFCNDLEEIQYLEFLITTLH